MLYIVIVDFKQYQIHFLLFEYLIEYFRYFLTYLNMSKNMKTKKICEKSGYIDNKNCKFVLQIIIYGTVLKFVRD